jgi:O-succinylbenzoic acid--CoA ligase
MLTADLGSLVDGILTVTGRSDDVVQVGGQSVDLAAVTAVVRSLPGVVDAVVVAVPDREWGSIPMALVVGAIPASFDAVIGQQLGRAAVPRSARLVADLPRLASGKVDRLAAIEIVSGC